MAHDGRTNDLPDHSAVAADSESLHIVDSRTGSQYDIPIKNNAVHALEFKKIKLPLTVKSSDGVEKLAQGLRILDPGMNNTAVKESKITFVDGQEGDIQFRGHRIGDLVGKKTFEEVAYLLIWEHFPSNQQNNLFTLSLATYPLPPPEARAAIDSFPKDAPPVTMIIAGLAATNASRPIDIPSCRGSNIYVGDMRAVDQQIIRAISSTATLAAITYCHKMGREFTPPDPHLAYIENVLLMMGHVDPMTKLPDPKVVSYLNRLWVLTADHELTNSSATFLTVASSLNDPLTCLIAAYCSSMGILHGGAIEMAYKQLKSIPDVESVPAFLELVKAGKMRLYGFGHRLYKTVDPRFGHVQEMVDEITKGSTDTGVLSIALEIDRIARTDEYFTSRHLRPNADFLASIVYSALGFPVDFILPLSSISRAPGLLAHWRESMGRPPQIWRPQQIYTGDLAP